MEETPMDATLQSIATPRSDGSRQTVKAWHEAMTDWHNANAEIEAIDASVDSDDTDDACAIAIGRQAKAIDRIINTTAPDARRLYQKLAILEQVAFDELHSGIPTDGSRIPALLASFKADWSRMIV
jgi:hypothetical protein